MKPGQRLAAHVRWADKLVEVFVTLQKLMIHDTVIIVQQIPVMILGMDLCYPGFKFLVQGYCTVVFIIRRGGKMFEVVP